MTNIKNKISLPFKIIKSEVSGGFIDKVHNEFTGGIDIVNTHEDVLNSYFEANLQSPFTNQWVGGKSHRHVPINDGNDRSENRPEAWHLQFRNVETIIIEEDFSSYSTNDAAIAGFIGDGVSSVRTRVADNPGKKYFVLRGNPVGSRFLQTENLNEITEITYTFIVYVQNFITYDFNVSDPDYGLALEDPDDGENLVLQYSYDGTTWTNKKTIFLGSNTSSPTLKEITETVDLSSEKPKYVRFLQTAYTSAESPGDNYGITDIIITTKQITDNPKISFYSHAYRNSPPAYWTREEYSKRPLNIKNIKSSGSLLAGNFTQNYEVVQTSGRRITNNLVVDGFEADDVLTTQFITGSNTYNLPELNKISGSRSVIVERFNAPGSKEESSRGALDREGEEMSPNIPLPYRNIKIRQPFYGQLAQHNPQFGNGSTYKLLPETGIVDAVTIHKVNRNRLVRGNREQFDNGFVVHPIPRTDIQYSWITASAITTAAELGGYQSFKNTNTSGSYYNFQHAFDDINFIDGTHYGYLESYLLDEESFPILLGDDGYILITNGYEELTLDNKFLNSIIKYGKNIDLECRTFTTIPLDITPSYSEITNTTYTFTSWTSIRGGEHPITRKLRKNNYISTLKECENYIDPVVTFKYRPLEHSLQAFGQEDIQYNIKHTYTNNLSSVANKDLLQKLYLEQEDQEQFYDELYSIYAEGAGGSPITDFLSYKYREIIWPREENASLAKTRKRNAYYLDMSGSSRDGYDRQLGTQRTFWRKEQENRKRSTAELNGYTGSMDYSSLLELGSDFNISNLLTFADSTVSNYVSIFDALQEQNGGLHNSVATLENLSQEKIIFNLTGSVYDSVQRSSTRRLGLKFEIAGEFDHNFIETYGFNWFKNEEIKNDIGTIYSNTYYKTLLTANDSGDPTLTIKTDNDEIILNPKVRYLAFVGGAELNTGSIVQSAIIPNQNFPIGSPILFSQTLPEEDVHFSTLDFGLKRTAEQDSGRTPFFDSYEEYIEDVRSISKDYSTIPEFKISDHMDYYENGNFRLQNEQIFILDGQREYQSAETEVGSKNIQFYKSYLQSDLLKRHDKIKNENKNNSQIKSIKIKVSGIKKLLPYNGFYPQDRSIQLANLYGDYVEQTLKGGLYSIEKRDYGEQASLFSHKGCSESLLEEGRSASPAPPPSSAECVWKFTYSIDSANYIATVGEDGTVTSEIYYPVRIE
jgi:hypothetical protein